MDDEKIASLEDDVKSIQTQLISVKSEYDGFKKEIAREKADGTDYKGLCQKYARKYQLENRERQKLAHRLDVLASPEEMAKLVRQDEYEELLARMEEYNKMFEYLKHEMAHAENYKGQIAELELV